MTPKATLLTAVAALVAAAVLTGTPAPADASIGGSEAAVGPSAEALLVWGQQDWNSRKMREGLAELELSQATRPDWPLASRALGVALLRAGMPGRAEAAFARAMGESSARALALGTLSPSELPADTDPETVMGLAVSAQLLGRPREAERLYRAFADLVGPMTAEAGRAYARLTEVFEELGDDSWGDGEAELARAYAVDPSVDSALLLPRFPDPTAFGELEPYTRSIQVVPSPYDSLPELDSPPRLARWSAPSDTSELGRAVAEGTMPIEMLLTAEGEPLEVSFISPDEEADATPAPEAPAAEASGDQAATETEQSADTSGDQVAMETEQSDSTSTAGADTTSGRGPSEAVMQAVMSWRFEPAVRDGKPVEVRIVFGTPEPEETDTAAGTEEAQAEGAGGEAESRRMDGALPERGLSPEESAGEESELAPGGGTAGNGKSGQ